MRLIGQLAECNHATIDATLHDNMVHAFSLHACLYYASAHHMEYRLILYWLKVSFWVHEHIHVHVY